MSVQTKLMPCGYEAELSSLSACTKLMPCGYKEAFAALLLLVSLLCPDMGMGGEITLLAPRHDSTVYSRNAAVTFVVRISDEGDLKKLALQNTKTGVDFDPVGRWNQNGRHYVHYRVPLGKGKNTFLLSPVSREIAIKFRRLSSLINVDLSNPDLYLFHRNERIPAECGFCHGEKLPDNAEITGAIYGRFSPSCYSCHKDLVIDTQWPHGPSANLICNSCHMEKSESKEIVIPTGEIASLCFKCHVGARKWDNLAHVHGPVGTGDCTICHDPHGDLNRYQLWADGKSQICVECHADKQKLVKDDMQRFYVHGILTAKGCVACHSPHATENRFQLYEPINALCSGCHTALKGVNTGHPVARHPLEGKVDPRRDGYPFTCTSCHNPHGSKYKYLLIGDIRGGQVCTKCHKGQLGNKIPGFVR